MSRIIEKYRKEAYDLQVSHYNKYTTWRHAILESIFRPVIKVPGKDPLSHLHPDLHKLHLPDKVLMPDWRKYQVEDHPALVAFQKRCHASGLHDPWLRNYAHRFYPNMNDVRSRMAVVTKGLSFGFCAAVVVFGIEKIYDHFYPTIYPHTKEYIEKHGTGGHHH